MLAFHLGATAPRLLQRYGAQPPGQLHVRFLGCLAKLLALRLGEQHLEGDRSAVLFGDRRTAHPGLFGLWHGLSMCLKNIRSTLLTWILSEYILSTCKRALPRPSRSSTARSRRRGRSAAGRSPRWAGSARSGPASPCRR